MNFTNKNVGLTALGCLVVGLCLGFIPEYVAKSHVETKVSELTNQGVTTQSTLHQTQLQLELNEFALQAAIVSATAQTNNYADASADASALFTRLRQYVDTANDGSSNPTLREILSMRDPIIAGLAKADPSIRPTLVQMFQKLATLSSQAKH